jgi:hypothetical protein
MILAVMTLEQWIEANNLHAHETLEQRQQALSAALERLQTTDTQHLLLVQDSESLAEFMTYAQQHVSVVGRDDFDPKAHLIVSERFDLNEGEQIREAHRHISPKSIVSFVHAVQHIDEFDNLSFYNPGEDFQHYHAWVQANLPIHPSRRMMVMAVGEIVQQDLGKMADALLPILEKKDLQTQHATILAKLGALIARQEAGPDGVIYNLKMGKVETKYFDMQMVTMIHQEVGLQVTLDEFEAVWQATNPAYSQIEEKLQGVDAQAIRAAGYDFELIGYTNEKDMSHLLKELQKHDAAYHVAKGQLIGFAGLRLACSYVEQKSVQEMLNDLMSRVTYPASYLMSQTPQKTRSQPVYYVSSKSQVDNKPGMTNLIGWNGSSVQIWANEQIEAQEQDDLDIGSNRRQRSGSLV